MRYRAVASTPRDGIFTVVVRAVDQNDRCLYNHPRIELPVHGYDHAQAIVRAYNMESTNEKA